MKAEDLKDLLIRHDRDRLIMGWRDKVFVVEVRFRHDNGQPDFFQTKSEALRVAALCRAAYEMREALKSARAFLVNMLNDVPGPYRRFYAKELASIVAAIELSENQSETVTP